ncbi:MAG TPA: hypothetical protein VFQ68_28125 [Streptosporangiaceae bacterium]|nr:hypothetical protein [Streptosporangiaceae bacterium]
MTPVRTATRSMLPEIKAGDFPDGVAITPDGRTVYVLNGASKTLTPISAAAGKARTPIPLPGGPTAIAFRR